MVVTGFREKHQSGVLTEAPCATRETYVASTFEGYVEANGVNNAVCAFQAGAMAGTTIMYIVFFSHDKLEES